MEITAVPVENRKSITIVMESGERQTETSQEAQPAFSRTSGGAASDLNSYFKSMQDTHKITVSIGYLASGDMAKIYAASSTGAVRGVIYSVNSNMKRMQHSGASEDQIDEVVRKMKRVLGKAQTKLCALKREAAMENRRRLAELMQKREASRQMTDRLRKKRYVRRAREYCEIVDAGDVLSSPSRQAGLPGAEAPAPVGMAALPLGAVAAAPAAAAVQAAPAAVAAAPAASLNVVV